MEDYEASKTDSVEITFSTFNRKEADLMLNAVSMSLSLYDICGWRRAIYNNKDYGGHVVYKGKLYDRNEWYMMKHSPDEYEEDGYTLKEKPIYCYTDDDIIHKLDELLCKSERIVMDYYE